MDFGRYLAKCLKVGKHGSFSIEDILNAHRITCKAATETQELQMKQEGPAESAQFRARNYKVFPLCRAILVILDTPTVIEDLTTIPGKSSTKLIHLMNWQ